MTVFFPDWMWPLNVTVETLMQKEVFANTGEADCENLFNMGRGAPKTVENVPGLSD